MLSIGLMQDVARDAERLEKFDLVPLATVRLILSSVIPAITDCTF